MEIITLTLYLKETYNVNTLLTLWTNLWTNMPNPFERKFDGECNRCEQMMVEGDLTYAHDDEYICWECADDMEIVCACDAKKSPDYDECYDCHNVQ